MKSIIVIFIASLIYNSTIAQDTTQLSISANTPVNDVAKFSKIYKYPAFTEGYVILNNGGVSKVKLDYNLLLQEMQFINPAGDTLALADESNVHVIAINNDTFYIHKVPYQLIGTYRQVKLVKHNSIKVVEVRKRGAYNMPAPTGAVDTYSNQFGQFGYRFQPNSDVILGKDVMYYLITPAKEVVPLLRKNILSTFSDNKSSISNYLKQHNLNLNKEDDIVQLFNYINTL